MRLSDIPKKLAKPWASAAGSTTIHDIPVASQIGITDGAASLTDGFPPLNATRRSSGGVPPDIKDFNRILQWVSEWTVWFQSGGAMRYDPAYISQNGGYPLGSILQSAVTIGQEFASTVDNNITDPDSIGSANWITLGARPATSTEFNNGTGGGFVTPALLHGSPRSFTINGYVFRSDGLLEQWGQAVSGAGDSTPYRTVAFNIPFPNACIHVMASSAVEYHGAADGNEISARMVDSASFQIGSDDTARLSNWHALGF
jgi:hypothetical protein